jgi:serine/threonine-protein kinase PpkA
VPASAATVAAVPAVPRAGGNGEPATRALPRAAPAPVENATMVRQRSPAAPTPAPTPAAAAAAPAAPVAAHRAWMRAWPLLIVLVGVGLIAYALIGRMGKQGAPKPVPVVVVPKAQPEATPAPAPTASDLAPNSSTSAAPAPAAVQNPLPATTAMDSVEAADAHAAGAEAAAEELPTVVDPVVEAVRLGRIDLAAQRLTLPAGTNALERFSLALKLDPKNKGARQGVVDIAKKYVELAEKSRAAGDLNQWDQYLKRAVEVAKTVPDDDDEVIKLVAVTRQNACAPFVAQGKTAAAAWDKAAAKTAYEKALQLDPDNEPAREGLKFVATIGEPGFTFHDKLGDGQGPELVIIDAHIAMAHHDVTRGEFRRYWSAAGHSEFADANFSCRDRESLFRSSKKRNWENPDIPQDDNHPVVCVSWQEAAAYAQWLSKQTGKHYRLATPAEFDLVARKAGNGACKANLADASFNRQYESHDGGDCDDGFAATAPVAHFPATAGVADIDGNVRVWVAACGNGAAPEAGNRCRDFMVKGRAWLSVGSKEPPTFQDTYSADVALNSVGIRVVRDLDK